MPRRKKETDQEFFARLINKQFEIAGHTDISYDILVSNKEAEDEMPFEYVWYRRYTTTKEQEDEFREWARVEFKKRFKYLNKKYLERELGLFLLMWGLSCTDCVEFLKEEQ